MKIVLIGAGNVATVLGKLFYNNGYHIVQVLGRHLDTAEMLANQLNCKAVLSIKDITKEADLYIIAIPDDAISGIAEELRLSNNLVVHTAGTLPLKTIDRISSDTGIMWPLQSLRKEIKEIPEIPFVIDGNNKGVTEKLKGFLNSVSNSIIVLNDEERIKLHLSAVMVSNFTNHLYTLAQDYCKEYNLPFNFLNPLITETALRLNLYKAKDVQTGPSIRGDITTLTSHLALLEEHTQLKMLYKQFDKSIRETHSK